MYSFDCAHTQFSPEMQYHILDLYRSDGTQVFDHVYLFTDGTFNIGPIDVAANETLTVKIDFSFYNDSLAKDWSVVAFGEDGSSNL